MTVCILNYQHKCYQHTFCCFLSCTITVYLQRSIQVSILQRMYIILRAGSNAWECWAQFCWILNIFLSDASANWPVKYVMLMNVLDGLSNLWEYFQYFSLVHRLVTLCQILCQCPVNKQQQFQISFNTDPENICTSASNYHWWSVDSYIPSVAENRPGYIFK